MLSEPTIEHRDEQPCAGIRVPVTLDELSDVVQPLSEEVVAWLKEHDIEPAGPEYIRFHLIDMEGVLEIEVGVATSAPIDGDDRVSAGHFPAGLYATAVHTGHPDDLVGATSQLLDWATTNGITWQMTKTDAGEAWVSRTEFYLNSADEPDMTKWRTELAFLTAINDSTG